MSWTCLLLESVSELTQKKKTDSEIIKTTPTRLKFHTSWMNLARFGVSY